MKRPKRRIVQDKVEPLWLLSGMRRPPMPGYQGYGPARAIAASKCCTIHLPLTINGRRRCPWQAKRLHAAPVDRRDPTGASDDDRRNPPSEGRHVEHYTRLQRHCQITQPKTLLP